MYRGYVEVFVRLFECLGYGDAQTRGQAFFALVDGLVFQAVAVGYGAEAGFLGLLLTWRVLLLHADE